MADSRLGGRWTGNLQRGGKDCSNSGELFFEHINHEVQRFIMKSKQQGDGEVDSHLGTKIVEASSKFKVYQNKRFQISASMWRSLIACLTIK
jgi:hypothetical protein